MHCFHLPPLPLFGYLTVSLFPSLSLSLCVSISLSIALAVSLPGVGKNCSTDDDLDHTISIAGYGTTDAGVPYWLVRNSWWAVACARTCVCAGVRACVCVCARVCACSSATAIGRLHACVCACVRAYPRQLFGGCMHVCARKWRTGSPATAGGRCSCGSAFCALCVRDHKSTMAGARSGAKTAGHGFTAGTTRRGSRYHARGRHLRCHHRPMLVLHATYCKTPCTVHRASSPRQIRLALFSIQRNYFNCLEL